MAMTRMFATAAVAVMVAACGSSGGGGGNGSGGGGDDQPGPGNNPGQGSGGSTSAAAPKILSLHTNVSAMTPADTLVISVVVTDPQGIDDVIGGDLLTPDGVAAYGSFATDANEGAYSITLSWSAMNTIVAVNAAAGATESRTLRAEFYDVEGNTTWHDVTIMLGCGGTKAACDGACEDLTSRDSCASCGHVCDPAENCIADASGTPQGCGGHKQSPEASTCGGECASMGDRCVDGVAMYGFSSQLEIGCNVTPAATNGDKTFSFIDCICVD